MEAFCLYKYCLLATPVCVFLFAASLHSQLFTLNYNFHFPSFISPFCSLFSFSASFPCDIHSHLPNHRISASSSRKTASASIEMHFLTLILSSVLALGASAVPTPESTTANAPLVFDMPAAPYLEARDFTGLIRLCTDFNAGGRCADVTIPSGAITTSPLAQGFSAFEVDGGQVCNLLGGCPSSAKIISPGLDCNLSDSFNPFTGCGLIAGDGHQITIDSLTG
jgi:hypothetical protein